MVSKALGSEKNYLFKFEENPWKKYMQDHPEEAKAKTTDTKDTWKLSLVFPPPNNTDSAKYFAQKMIELFSTGGAAH